MEKQFLGGGVMRFFLSIFLCFFLFLSKSQAADQCLEYRVSTVEPWQSSVESACATFIRNVALERGTPPPFGPWYDEVDGVRVWRYATGWVYKIFEMPKEDVLGGKYLECSVGVSRTSGEDIYAGVGYSAISVRECPEKLSIKIQAQPSLVLSKETAVVSAVVTRSSGPASGMHASIGIDSRQSCSGLTDGQGRLACSFTAPTVAQLTTIPITGTCSDCEAPANATLQILPIEKPTNQCEAQQGNPILPATGSKEQTAVDFSDAGVHGLDVVWRYISTPLAGRASGGWNLNWGAIVQDLGSAVLVRETAGGVRAFRLSGAGNTGPLVYEPVGHNDKLTLLSGNQVQYQRASDGSTWLFNAQGRLATQTGRNGWVYAYSYDEQGRLIRVSNHFGRALVLGYEGNNFKPSQITTPDGQVLRYSWSTSGLLTQTTYPDARSKTYVYEDSRHPTALTGIVDESGTRYASYSYDAQGRAISTEHAGGVERHAITYPSTSADPTVVRDPLGTSRAYTYEVRQGKLSVSSGSLPSAQSQVASRVQDGTGFITRETDFLGINTLYSWDPYRHLPLSSTEAAGTPQERSTRTEWHPSWSLPVRVTEAGRQSDSSYDTQGNLTQLTVTDTASGVARTWRYSYNAQGLLDSATGPDGGTTRYSYTAQGLLSRVTDALGRHTDISSDGAGRPLRVLTPDGRTTTQQYDARGRLLSTTVTGAALVGTGPSLVTQYSYTPSGQLASLSLPSGQVISYQYDAAQRLTGWSDNRGAQGRYQLDAAGNVIDEQILDASSALAWQAQRSINALGRIASDSNAGGAAQSYGYDANGRPTSQRDSLGNTHVAQLDALGRLSALTLPDGNVERHTLNAQNQTTQFTDAGGTRTQYQRNALGDLLQESSPDTGTTTHTVDAAGRRTSSTDATGRRTTIERDALGRPTRITHTAAPGAKLSASQDTRLSWDANDQLAALQDASGSTQWERDSLGRITRKTQTVNDNPSAPGSYSLRYGYSGTQLSQITYPSGLIVYYKRAANGRITGIELQEPGKNKPVQAWLSNLEHNALGQPQRWSWASGDSSWRRYDTQGRLIDSNVLTLSYDAGGRVQSLTDKLWASLVVPTPSTPGGTATATTTATVTQTITTPITWQVQHDSRSRLVQLSRNATTSQWGYDANSNRVSELTTTTSDTDLDGQFEASDYTQRIDKRHQLQAGSNRLLGWAQTTTTQNKGKTTSTLNSQVSYQLDEAGSLINDGLKDLDHDASGRLAQVRIIKDGEAAKISYQHNALGQRVFKSEPQAEHTLPNQAELGTSFIDWLKKNFGWLFAAAQANATLGQSYLYADDSTGLPSWALLGEYGNGGSKSTGRWEYVWLPTEDGQAIPVGVYKGGHIYALHTDHLGTPRRATNEAGSLVWQWPISGFGDNKPSGYLKATQSSRQALTNDPVLLRATSPSLELNLRYPGQYFDEETGLHYNLHRSYLPGQGRYTQSDPIGLGGGSNRFGYVGGMPFSKTDPTGLLEHFMMALNNQPTSSLECGCGDKFPAFSGNPPYRNDPDSTTQPDIGAAPEGWYFIVDRPSGGLIGTAMSSILGKDKWFGLYRDDGTPGDDTNVGGVTRKEIRLHPLGPRGSLGCVTLANQADFDRLRRLLMSTTTSTIPGTNIKYYGTILLYRPGVGGLW